MTDSGIDCFFMLKGCKDKEVRMASVHGLLEIVNYGTRVRLT
jgi:hypothetical protein